MHPNSVKAFSQLKHSGQLSEQEVRAVEEIVARGPGTSRELDERIGHGGRAWHPTYHRLERRGVLKVIGSRPCTISGKTAMVYEYTTATSATALPPKPSRKERLAFILQTPVPTDPKLALVRQWLIGQLV